MLPAVNDFKLYILENDGYTFVSHGREDVLAIGVSWVVLRVAGREEPSGTVQLIALEVECTLGAPALASTLQLELS